MDCLHTRIVVALGGPSAVARLLEIKAPSVFGWADESGQYTIPRARLVELGAQIEAVMGEEASRRTLFPTRWHLIWPELVETAEQAPTTDQAFA